MKSKQVIALVIAGLISLLVVGLIMSFLAKRAGTALLQGAIESKTGQTVTVGTEKLPDTFPKDFPVYPGAKVISSVSGIQQDKTNGIIVTFTTTDGLDKVVPFYKSGLSINGWTITSSFDSDSVQTWVIAKGSTQGNVSISSQKDLTTIQVALGDKE